MMLSDDPYGDINPVPYLTRQLYIPELSVGRLVETPNDIAAHAQPVREPDGQRASRPDDLAHDGLRLPLRRSVARERRDDDAIRSDERRHASGRSAHPVDAAAQHRTGDSWTLAQLIGAFLPTTASAPSITSLNGHASHYQFQPPDERRHRRARAAVHDHGDDRDRHGFAHEPARVQHGLPRRALGRRLDRHGKRREHARLAAGLRAEGARRVPRQHRLRLRRQPRRRVLGRAEQAVRAEHRRRSEGRQCSRAAKQAYYGELGVFGVYDEKAMAEFTLYGLPMWGVSNAAGGTGAAAPLSAASALSASDATPAAPAASATAAPSPDIASVGLGRQ